MFGVLNDFIYGALWLGLVIALGFTGWRAVHSGYFKAVSESYRGRAAQTMGGACLLIAVVAGLFFLQRLLGFVLLGVNGDGAGALGSGLFFVLGAGLGAYLTLRYYVRSRLY